MELLYISGMILCANGKFMVSWLYRFFLLWVVFMLKVLIDLLCMGCVHVESPDRSFMWLVDSNLFDRVIDVLLVWNSSLIL